MGRGKALGVCTGWFTQEGIEAGTNAWDSEPNPGPIFVGIKIVLNMRITS